MVSSEQREKTQHRAPSLTAFNSKKGVVEMEWAMSRIGKPCNMGANSWVTVPLERGADSGFATEIHGNKCRHSRQDEFRWDNFNKMAVQFLRSLSNGDSISLSKQSTAGILTGCQKGYH